MEKNVSTEENPQLLLDITHRFALKVTMRLKFLADGRMQHALGQYVTLCSLH